MALGALVAGLLLSGARAWVVPAAVLVAVVMTAATRRALPALVAVALLLAGWATGSQRRDAIDRSRLDGVIGNAVTVRGYVIRRERPSAGANRLRLHLTSVAPVGSPPRSVGDLVQVRVPVGASLPPLAIGDEVRVEGSLAAPSNPPQADFDYAGYLRRAGVHAVLRARSISATGHRRGSLAGRIDSIRRRAELGVGMALDPGQAALARGMVLGEDERVPADVVDDFKASGLSHLLAVSGQNVTLLAILAWPLLSALGLGRRGRLIGVLGLIALYVPLTGASPSIVRAGAMGVAGTVAALAGRPASRSYALLLSAAFTLALDPRAWLDPGWQLSFAAVLGIFCLAPGFTRAMTGLPKSLAAGTAVTLAATLATAPLMAFQFGRVPLVSLPANLLALPAVAPIMWLGMLAAATGQVWAPAASLLNGVDAYCLAYLTQVARWSARWPGAGSPVRIGSAAGLALAYAALAATVLALFRLWARMARPRERAAGAGTATALMATAVPALAAALALALLLYKGDPAPPAQFAASFLDVGQGDAVLLQPPGGAVLVDGGPPDGDLVAKLRAHGVHALDVVVLTHPQRDHEGGLADVLRSFPVGTLLDGGSGSPDRDHRRIVALAATSGERVIPARAGQILSVAGLRLEVLSPPKRFDPEGDEPNRQAVVMLASYRGLDLMLPADAESDVTLALPLQPVEVLKVAHHGSEDEGLGALLDRLRPQVAVIEVGARNPFGHPRAQALRTLLASVPRVLRTDRDGEVRVSFGARGMVVQSER